MNIKTNLMTGALAGLVASALLCFSSPAHAQMSKKCNADQKAKAKAHYDLAEAQNNLKAYDQAAKGYLKAHDICPRPWLLFNAGQAHWSSADKAKTAGEDEKSRTLRIKALDLYKRYIELAPTDQGADLAREQFCVFAEELFLAGKKQDAENYYKLCLELDPQGSKAGEAQARVDEFAKEREARRAEEQAAREAAEAAAARDKAEADRLAAQAEPERVEKPGLPTAVDTGTPVDEPPGPDAYRIGFYATVGISVVSIAAAGVTLLQVGGSLKNAKEDAIRDYQNATGQQLDLDDACAEAEIATVNPTLAGVIVDACDKGKFRVTISKVFQGVALASAAAAGFFLYKGFLQKRGRTSTTETAMLRPALTPHSVGAQLMIRF